MEIKVIKAVSAHFRYSRLQAMVAENSNKLLIHYFTRMKNNR